VSANALLTETALKYEIAAAFHRAPSTIAVHAYPPDHPLGMPGQTSIHVGIPLRPRGRDGASWTRHSIPQNWQIMAMHEARSAFLDGIIARLRDQLRNK